MGLLGCEKGEEKRSRAEVTHLDLRLPSLRFHSNDQAAVEVVQHGGQCALARHKRCTEGLTTNRPVCTRPWQQRDEDGAVCSFGNAACCERC
jgi:hypothetical protein